MKNMKMIHVTAVMLVTSFGLVSCMPVTGTQEQQARAVEANSRMAQSVGIGLLGAAAAVGSVALLKRESRRSRNVWYGPWGRYRTQYWHPRYGWVW